MDDLLDALKNSRVFNALDEEERRRLLPKFTPVKLSDGNILFYQGDVSDSVYLLVSGKLSAEVLTVSDESRIVGHIEAGETVGEMGAMSGEPRSLTVRALRDAELLRLSANDFMAICHRNPRVLFAALSPIVTRTNSIIQMLSSERVNKRIIVLPASKDIVLKDFAESLTKHTHHLKNTLVISDYQEEFKDKNIHFSEVSENIKKLGQNKKKIRHYIYILSAYDTPLARASFKHADVVYVVAKADSTPHIDHEVLDKIASTDRIFFSSSCAHGYCQRFSAFAAFYARQSVWSGVKRRRHSRLGASGSHQGLA
jgi:NTE family protein